MPSRSNTTAKSTVSLVQFLTGASVDGCECDAEQIRQLGGLSHARKTNALQVLGEGLKRHSTSELRRRLIQLLRTTRQSGDRAGSDFLFDLLCKIEGDTMLVARERAVRSAALGDDAAMLNDWIVALATHKDVVAITSVANHVPRLFKANNPECLALLRQFVELVAARAPDMPRSEPEAKAIEEKVNRFVSVLGSSGLILEAGLVGRAIVDLKLRWGMN